MLRVKLLVPQCTGQTDWVRTLSSIWSCSEEHVPTSFQRPANQVTTFFHSPLSFSISPTAYPMILIAVSIYSSLMNFLVVVFGGQFRNVSEVLI